MANRFIQVRIGLPVTYNGYKLFHFHRFKFYCIEYKFTSDRNYSVCSKEFCMTGDTLIEKCSKCGATRISICEEY